MKNNRPITVDYIKYTKIRRGLRIKPVEKSDAGVYHCLAGSALRSRDARLTIECKFYLKTGQYSNNVFIADRVLASHNDYDD